MASISFSWAKNLGKALQGVGIGAAAVALQASGAFAVDSLPEALVAGGVPQAVVVLASPYFTPVLVGVVASGVNWLKNRNRPAPQA